MQKKLEEEFPYRTQLDVQQVEDPHTQIVDPQNTIAEEVEKPAAAFLQKAYERLLEGAPHPLVSLFYQLHVGPPKSIYHHIREGITTLFEVTELVINLMSFNDCPNTRQFEKLIKEALEVLGDLAAGPETRAKAIARLRVIKNSMVDQLAEKLQKEWAEAKQTGTEAELLRRQCCSD